MHVKIGLKSRPIVSNRLYCFENTKTWHEVFDEVCDDDFFLRKTDGICVTVSDRLGHSFEPDLEEPIQVVQEFDSALKFATFDVNRYASSSEENDINNECEHETSSTPPNCFNILMKAQLQCTKLPQLLNEDAPRFTGLF